MPMSKTLPRSPVVRSFRLPVPVPGLVLVLALLLALLLVLLLALLLVLLPENRLAHEARPHLAASARSAARACA